MNSQKFGLRVASLLLALFAIAHFVRLFTQMSVVIGGHIVPIWISAPAGLIAALLSFWMWTLSRSV